MGQKSGTIRHIFIIGSKSIGQYGGYETFVDHLISEHEKEGNIKYHVACKANGDGHMDESKLEGVHVLKKKDDGSIVEFEYKNAHVFKILCPNIGPAVAIYYDTAAVKYSIDYCKKNAIEKPIFYILTCRIGLFIDGLVKQIKEIGGVFFLNPDGHEFLRAKWPKPIRKYWKWSEKKMVKKADLIICDSVSIEKYIKEEYHHQHTTYIAYGSDTNPSTLSNDDPKFFSWMKEKKLNIKDYYLIVGRFVPENNYKIMISEFMNSQTSRDLAIVTNMNDKLKKQLEAELHFNSDPRIKFVGTVYDKELLKKIRENAFAYFHGHEVGGTNPSLLEALGSTDINLLLDVCFNREVAQQAALYWNKTFGNLSELINYVDKFDNKKREEYGRLAKDQIEKRFSWKMIAMKYKTIWRLD